MLMMVGADNDCDEGWSSCNISLIRSGEMDKDIEPLPRRNHKVVEEALEVGTDGIVRRSSLGTGTGDLVRALIRNGEGWRLLPPDINRKCEKTRKP